MIEDTHSAQEKALAINLDGMRHGTFAEIGAGQEVARWFFHVGKASSTVARSISAYDMAISDGLYGPAEHYVSRARLEAMLDREFRQLIERLDRIRGEQSAFFVFADTVATHASSRSSGGHGWLGLRYQDKPRGQPSEVIIHVEMLDAYAVSQQETVGLVGVNLLYGAFTLGNNPPDLIGSLMDGLDRRRVEIDMIKFSGPQFSGVDNRLMSLQLVERGLTDSAMFTNSGEVVQPSEVLRGRAVVIERGSFRPVTNVNVAMLESALGQIENDSTGSSEEPMVLMEMTLKNLMSAQAIDHRDFLARADVIGALHRMVMISNYSRFGQVTTCLRQYTLNWLGFVAGVPTLRAIFDEQYYQAVEGGILGGLGELFNGRVKLFAYPTVSTATGEIETAETIAISPKLHHLFAYLLDNGFIEPVRRFDSGQLHVAPSDVLRMIQAGDAAWTDFVPADAAALIRRKELFGYVDTTGTGKKIL